MTRPRKLSHHRDGCRYQALTLKVRILSLGASIAFSSSFSGDNQKDARSFAVIGLWKSFSKRSWISFWIKLSSGQIRVSARGSLERPAQIASRVFPHGGRCCLSTRSICRRQPLVQRRFVLAFSDHPLPTQRGGAPTTVY
jgi:hypothetical protein